MTNPDAHIAKIRADYTRDSLGEEQVGDDPVAFFRKWFQEAEAAGVSEVNAMTLATVDASSRPSARIVLLKGLEDDSFVFFSNYDSNKGEQMAAQPDVALLFFWKELERQVRVEGRVEKIPAADSETYFHSRPKGSQISALASPQSQVIAGREILEDKVKQLEQQYASGEVPRPEHWGGYRVIPTRIEFWQGRHNRLHDRIVFTGSRNNGWTRQRLAP
ncbi:pyridoxamine 5'-phosphate oxidase [Taibaiella chishuiensis]|uniref:Pyridoxine/pyridoxamine 5'-phosphate oxidase n=1 Tax=Taibaiella chishuiensis TaxID=1434707 RepID=A0A2P8CWF5_9BACT|nr:pyridoxamine 5'-phosphate oxidase [Taibaiella chishuiensis]PSK89313.1 pyridoxamine 5'-phosphate oxidase [Taibaiella chishuiensis]